MTLFEAWH
jgi:hypothetical protein